MLTAPEAGKFVELIFLYPSQSVLQVGNRSCTTIDRAEQAVTPHKIDK